MEFKNKPAVKIGLGKKIIIGAGSFIVFLVLLEIGIRLFVFGFFSFLWFHGGYEHTKLSGKRILAVGDSYTFGGDLNAQRKTYPDILQRKLDAARKGDFSVINKGKCESTTGELYRNLPKWLDKYKPEVVVMLVGSSNRFRAWENIGASRSATFRWFTDLRVVKMARIVWLNLKARDAAGSFDGVLTKLSFLIPTETYYISIGDVYNLNLTMRNVAMAAANDPVKKLWEYGRSRKYQEGIVYGRSMLEDGKTDNIKVILILAELYYESGAYDDTDALLTAAREENPRSKILRTASAYYYEKIANGYRGKSQNGKAVKYFLKEIELDPNRRYSYYLMNKVFSLQSYYDSDRIYRELSRMAQANPLYSESDVFTKNLKYYHEKQRWEDGIEQRANNDLDRIAALCRQHKARLIVMNYPIDYPMANRSLEKLAMKHKLPFVDNLTAFKDVKPKKKYFYDDDHCTVEGHRIMADNVYRKIITEKELLP
ncbi:MAG: hypothetical protein AB1546_14690 [bacterium]